MKTYRVITGALTVLLLIGAIGDALLKQGISAKLLWPYAALALLWQALDLWETVFDKK